MVDKLAKTMYVFGIIFLIVAIIAAICSYLAAMSEERDAATLSKDFFSHSLFFALLLWILAWLIS